MTIRSRLEPFSLPGLFQVIDGRNKSGRLIVKTQSANPTSQLKAIYLVWFQDGYIIAVSDRLNYRGLIELIEKLNYLSPVITQKLRTLCPPGVPLGVYLSRNKLLTKEKLNFIFQLQLHQLYNLFQLESGQFQFDESFELKDKLFTIPWLEMTGHRIRTIQAAMHALRLAQNWSKFQDYLPAATSGIRSLVKQPRVKLLSLERAIWNQADGNTSLNEIALNNQQSIQTIQVTALLLILLGLLEETFIRDKNSDDFS